jgi:long-subunit fatty acid transport protein
MKLNKFLFILLVLGIAFSLNAQSFNLNGNGARSAGMGYAFTGVADDASAIAWNPAGLTQLESMEASAIARFGFGSASKDYDPGTGLGWYLNGNNFFLEVSDANYDVSSKTSLNFASFIIPLEIGSFKIVAGGAYRNLYDFAGANTFTAEGELSMNGNVISSNSTYQSKSETFGGVNAISPSLAMSLNDMVSVGITFNFLSGSYGESFSNTIEGNPISDYSEKDYIEFSGNSMDIGVLLKLSDMFRIGGTFNLGHTLSMKNKLSDDTFDLEVPMFYSVGIGLNLGDNFLLAADYHSRPWSNAEYDDGDIFSDYDINSFHAGLEYLIFLGNVVMPVRAGFYTQPTLNEDANGDQIASNRITGGIGLVLGNIVLDGAVEYGKLSYLNTKFDSGEEINYSQNDLLITFGATFHFGN